MHSFLLEDMAKKKTYEVQRATIARYFQSYFDSNAQSVRLHTEQGREMHVPPNRHSVSFMNATFTVFYPNGARLELSGNLNVLFAPASDLVECMEFNTTSSEDIIARTEISRVLDTWSPTMNKAASPKMTKNKLPKAQNKMQSQFEGLTIDSFPKVTKGDLGVATRVQSFLEVSADFSSAYLSKSLTKLADWRDYEHNVGTGVLRTGA